MFRPLKGALAITCLLFLCFVLREKVVSQEPSSGQGFEENQQHTENMRILTFNAGLFELRLFGFSIVKPADFLHERLRAMPQALLSADADVIGIQEVYFKEHQQYFIDNLKSKYPYHCFERNKAVKVNNGLMFFSKHPIRDYKYIPFENRGPIDERTVAQKGVLTCVVETSNGKLIRFVNIHPTAGGLLNAQDSPTIQKIRNDQISQSHDIAKEGEELAVILGDFNTGPEIAIDNYNYLLERGYIDGYAEYCQVNNLTAEMTWDAKNILNVRGTHSESISQRIDHIYLQEELLQEYEIISSKVVFSEPTVKVNGEMVTVSDHYGVIVDLKEKSQ